MVARLLLSLLRHMGHWMRYLVLRCLVRYDVDCKCPTRDFVCNSLLGSYFYKKCRIIDEAELSLYLPVIISLLTYDRSSLM